MTNEEIKKNLEQQLQLLFEASKNEKGEVLAALSSAMAQIIALLSSY